MLRQPDPNPLHVRPFRRDKVAARTRMRERLESVGYQIRQRCRKKIEEYFGWMKTAAGLGRSRWKLQQQPELTAAACHLIRMRKLLPSR